MGRYLREFESLYAKAAENIFFFCELLGFQPSPQQCQILQAVQDGHRRIAVKSGQGPGKTACSVVIGLWRSLRTYMGLTIITAPTMRQCRDVWLKEARLWHSKAHPAFQKLINITKSKVSIAGDPDWGVLTVTATKEENAQGYHQASLTVIAEEASGVPREIITQFKGTLSNPDSLFLMIGNPNTRDCAFFDCFNRQRHKWHCITLNAEESPPHIVNPARNKELEEEFGRDSDVYRVRVLGEFPHTDPNSVISSEELEKCVGDATHMYKHVVRERSKTDNTIAKQISLDFARFGGDENTVFRRSGNAIVEWKYFAHTEPARVVEYAFRLQAEAGWKDSECWYVGDAGGMGQGLMHKFHDAGKRILEFHNGSVAVKSTEYENRITEAWFMFAKRVKAGLAHIPDDNQLFQQLCGRKYFTTKKGKLVIETKDEYMKRGNNSPDRADGLVMAFYDEITAKGNILHRPNAGHLVGAKISA